ncbi:adenylate kinase [Halobacteriales archaeon QH_10_70_21]|jgi:adenylate kinase|nr:MAG: adenylate kinase [Halobacteriales archaeon QH_10_70_21]
MRVAVTGTPGTGKTTAVDRASTDLEVVHLNELVRAAGLTSGEDDERGSLVADLEAIEAHLAGREDLLVESHLAHHLDADRVAVFRCHPEELRERLLERGEAAAAAAENAEAEALDVVLSEAVGAHGHDSVYEIDTTDRAPGAVAADLEAVVAGDRDPSAGEVDFTDYL